MSRDVDGLDAARAALDRHDWQAAHDAAVEAEPQVDGAEEAERLDLLADACWWLGRLDHCIDAREGAYRAFERLGDQRRAGRSAAWLYEHHCFTCRPAIARAWLARARRAVADDPDCVEHGAVLLREAERAHGDGDLPEATAIARRVVDLGRRLGSTDLETDARQALGRLQIDQGQVRQGLAELDEAMLCAVEGRVGPYVAGKVYCSLISACKDLGDLRRATEWTEATSRWAQQHPFAIFPGICRVHRATALEWRGSLAEAEREATRACTELVGLHVPNAAAAFAEVGEIRRRLGDLEGAETAFARAEELCGEPCTGVALLRLAQGEVDAAAALIAAAVDAVRANPLARSRLLPARAQIAIAAGDLDRAESAVEELSAVAADVGTTMLEATALSTRARLELARGRAEAAAATVREALARWQDLDIPYEIATARTILGQARRLAGDEEAARSSFAAAEAHFVELGARLDAEQVREQTSPGGTGAGLAGVESGDGPDDVPGRPGDGARWGGPGAPGGLTDRELDVLRLVAAGRTNKEVAADLYVSAKTVSRHLSNIFAKIGVSTRSAATAFAFRHDLVQGG